VQPDQAVPQEFALQFWNEDKTTNAALVLEAIGLLLGSKGAGVGYYAVLSCAQNILIYAPFAAPGGLRLHKITH